MAFSVAYSIISMNRLPRHFSESQNVIHLVISLVPLDPSLDFTAVTVQTRMVLMEIHSREKQQIITELSKRCIEDKNLKT